MDTKNKISTLSILSILFIFSFAACNNKATQETQDNYTIDLTAKYNNQTNSFFINKDGFCIALIKEVDKPERFYRFNIRESELDSIQRVFEKLAFNVCDTINESYDDGTQYVLLLENEKLKKEIIGGTCENYEELNKMVNYFIKKSHENSKIEVFRSLKIITPPKLNEIE